MIGPGWRKARKRMVRQLGVNALAKSWFRFKLLRDLKEWYLQRRALASSQIYQPIPDGMIRLLQMRPGYSLNTIECHLSYVNLHSSVDYVALSYTWQKQTPSIPILVNGKVKLITENLYLALIHLRKRGSTVLWADFLCINQDDRQERETQVSLMKDIYQQATVVAIWLGDSKNCSVEAFDAFHDMLEHVDWQKKLPRQFFDPIMMTEDPRKWRAIGDILYRQWFRRKWVIQEALAARRAFILCGKDAIALDLFLIIITEMVLGKALDSIMSYHPNRQELSGGPMKVAMKQLEFLVLSKIKETDFMHHRDYKRTLLNLLAGTRWAEATDPRDKVYGILSLAEDAGSLGYRNTEAVWVPFRVDYEISKEQVFINTAKSIVYATKSLDILRFAGKQSNRGYDLPSWVPDWENEEPDIIPDYTSTHSIHESARDSWRPDREGSDTAAPYCIRREITLHCLPSFTLGSNNTLTVRGIHHDTLTAVSKNAWPSIDRLYSIDQHATNHKAKNEALNFLETQLEQFQEWIHDCTREAIKCSPYPTGENTRSALWRTLKGETGGEIPTGNLLPGMEFDNIREARSALAFACEKYRFMCANSFDSLSEVVLELAVSRMEDLISPFRNMGKVCSYKKFATTRKKYMGLVPREARVGDLICVIYGCESPFILRGNEGGAFEFIGHGSIHGLDFDDAVVESNVRTRRPWLRKPSDFSTIDSSGHLVYTTLKQTRDFTIS